MCPDVLANVKLGCGLVLHSDPLGMDATCCQCSVLPLSGITCIDVCLRAGQGLPAGPSHTSCGAWAGRAAGPVSANGDGFGV